MGFTQIHINYNLKYAFGNDVGLIPFISETVTRVYVTKGVTNIAVTNLFSQFHSKKSSKLVVI